MTEADLLIQNRLGLHARAAAKFVHLANTFSSQITVVKGTTRVDGKSILGLLTLAAGKGTRLKLSADGNDEADAVTKLGALVKERFGEAD